jgi:hypothetical protein
VIWLSAIIPAPIVRGHCERSLARSEPSPNGTG